MSLSPADRAEVQAMIDASLGHVTPGNDADIIAGPDDIGRVQYRVKPGTWVFNGELLRNGTVLDDAQRHNILINGGFDGDGHPDANGVQIGRLIPPVNGNIDPRPWKSYPQYYWPAPSREQRYGLMGLCKRYHWDSNIGAWNASPDTLANTVAFRTADTAMGIALLKGL